MKNLKLSDTIKSVIGENNKLTKAISFALLSLIMFGLFAFIMTGLYSFDLIEFPAVIQNIFFRTEDEGPQTGKDDGNIYEFLTRNDPDTGSGASGIGIGNRNESGFVLEIALDNIRDVLSRTKLPDNLYLETVVKYYRDGQETRTEEMSLWKKGGKYKYTLTADSELEELYINDSENEFIENFRTGSTIKRPLSGNFSFSFDNIPHIQNINYYLDLLERLGSGGITGVSVRQDVDSNINIAEIEYYIPLLDQRELIYISLDTGIVLFAETRIGESSALYYESRTTLIEAYYDGDAQAGTLIEDSLFEIRQP